MENRSTRSFTQTNTELHRQLSQVLLRGKNENVKGLIYSQANDSDTNTHCDIPFFSVATLTPTQRDLYLDYLANPDSRKFELIYSVKLGKNISPARWELAINQAVNTNPILKSRFLNMNAEFYQCVDVSMPVEFEFVESQGDPISLLSRPPFVLSECSARHLLIFDNKTGAYQAALECHHILLDAHSSHTFFQQVSNFYNSNPITSQFQDGDVPFHKLSASRISNFDSDETISYWKGEAEKISPLVQAVEERGRPTRKPRLEVLRLDQDHTTRVKEYCAELGISFAVYYRTVLGIVLARFYNPDSNFVLFDVRSGRANNELDVVGCLFQVRPFLFHHDNFCKTGAELRNLFLAFQEHQKSSKAFENLSMLQQRQIFGSRGIRFYTNFYNFPEIEFGIRSSNLEIHESYGDSEVHFIFEQFRNETEIRLAFNQANWSSSKILQRLQRVSEQIIDGCTYYEDIEITFVEEVYEVTEVLNSYSRHFEPIPSLVELFSEQVVLRRNETAVSFRGEQISYYDLNIRANQLSRYLRSLGVGKNSVVGLCLDPSIDAIVGMLGILKAGGAYLPIDPKCPTERVRFMVNDSGFKFCVTKSYLLESLMIPTVVKPILLDTNEAEIQSQPSTDFPNDVDSDFLAYIIYTSGSTGTPKGVMVKHRNIVRLFAQTSHWYQFNENDVWTMFHSIAFDFSVWEIWGALLHGGKLIIIESLLARSPNEFAKVLCEEGVTVLNQTPSAFKQLIQTEAQNIELMKHSLRYVIFGGEALNCASLQPWVERYGISNPELINMYGITETTVHVTYKKLHDSDFLPGAENSIGIPIPDLQVYLLDPFGKISPIGAIGEIFVGGGGLAEGYVNNPELTSERFIENKIVPEASELLYKTGDIGRWLPTGEISYLGRADQQVKIRGFRIELGEINAQVRKIRGIRDVATVVQSNQTEDLELTAYIVVDEELSLGEVLDCLNKFLPDYMIPASFYKVPVLPLTVNGKLDVESLNVEDRISHQLRSNTAVASSRLQRMIAQEWHKVLSIARIDVDDNFFEIGGDSLKLVVLLRSINARLDQVDNVIGMADLYKFPTIRSLSEFLETRCT